jgi:ABC-2 type transport system permease protein
MIALIRAEWIKVRSVRSYLWLVISALVLSYGLAVLVTATVPLDGEVRANVIDRIDLALVGSQLSWMLLGVIGVLIVGQEYRFNTIRVTFAATPVRHKVIAAKAVVVTGIAVVLGAISVAGSALIGGAILSSRGVPIDWTLSHANRIIPGSVLVGVLYALFGLAITCIVRQPIGGILLITVYPLIIESIIGGLLSKVGKWLPFRAVSQIASNAREDRHLGAGAGVAYFVAFLVAFAIGGLVLVRRRDA